MWVCPGFTASNIRNVALNQRGEAQGESPLDENKLLDAQTCAEIIIKAIEKRKRTLVMTFQGKETVFLNKFFPSLADKLVHSFFFKKGKLVGNLIDGTNNRRFPYQFTNKNEFAYNFNSKSGVEYIPLADLLIDCFVVDKFEFDAPASLESMILQAHLMCYKNLPFANNAF